MRLHRVLVPLLVLGGISFAQDTNFPIGPQYLVTVGNAMLLRSIATPSLSFNSETSAGTSEVLSISEPPPFAPLETITYLDNVYWGKHKPDEVVARRIETPIMSPDQTAWYTNAVASQFTSPPPAASAEATQAEAGPSVIELTGSQMPSNVPASMSDAVVVTGEPETLQGGGYGISLGDVAAYWKLHRRTAARVFTNSNVSRRG